MVLFAVAEQAVFPGVRVDAAQPDLGVGVAGAYEGVMAAAHGAFHQAGFDLGHGVDRPMWVVTWMTLSLGVDSIIDTSSVPVRWASSSVWPG